MDECPVCLEPFGLDEHIPKSLDCRHAVCTECVMNPRGQPLQLCPICRRGIGNRSDVPNDLSIIAYLEKKKRKKYLKERKKKLRDVIEQAREASVEVDGHLKEQKETAAKVVEERSIVFSSYIEHLFKKCLQLCDSKRLLNDVSTQNQRQLENTKEELETCIAACTPLIDNPHASTEVMHRCETDTLNAVKKAMNSGGPATSKEAMWNKYREVVLEKFLQLTKMPPSSDYSVDSASAVTAIHPCNMTSENCSAASFKRTQKSKKNIPPGKGTYHSSVPCPSAQTSSETTGEYPIPIPLSIEKLVWAFMKANFIEKLTEIVTQHQLIIIEMSDENPLNVTLKFCGPGVEAERAVDAFIDLYSEVKNCTRMEHVETAVEVDLRTLDKLAHKYKVVVLSLGNHKYGLIGTIGVSKLSQAKQELQQTSEQASIQHARLSRVASLPISIERLVWAFLKANFSDELTKIMTQHHLNIIETHDEHDTNPLNVMLKFCGTDVEAESGVNAFINLYSDVSSCTRMEHVDTAVDLDSRFLDMLAHKYEVVALKLGNHKYGLIGTIGVSKLSQAKQELQQIS